MKGVWDEMGVRWERRKDDWRREKLRGDCMKRDGIKKKEIKIEQEKGE